LTSGVQHIHLSSTISAISVDPSDAQLATIHCNTSSGSISHSGFRHIIFATQATRAVPLLSSYGSSLQPNNPKRLAVEKLLDCLRAFKYCTSVVINHTDSTLMPDKVRDRRELNLICIDSASSSEPIAREDGPWEKSEIPPTSYTMTTHVLQRPKGLPERLPGIYQTTNPIIPPRTECVLSVATLERAIVTAESKQALKGLYREDGRKRWKCAGQGRPRLGELQGAGRLSDIKGPGIWICGSFAAAGIPLLEGCVVSARNVVEQGIWEAEGIQSKIPPW
jgi:microfibrillar-associated protein 1